MNPFDSEIESVEIEGKECSFFVPEPNTYLDMSDVKFIMSDLKALAQEEKEREQRSY